MTCGMYNGKLRRLKIQRKLHSQEILLSSTAIKNRDVYMRYFLNKFIVLITTLILISLTVFFVFQILPGDPALIILGADADPKQIQLLSEKMGFDLPYYERYFNWVRGALQGDFGNSIRFNTPVLELMKARIPVTVQIGIFSVLLSVFIGIPLGILIGRYSDTGFGRFLSAVAQLGLAIPTFWLGLILILIFSITFSFFPSGQYVPIQHGFFLWAKSIFLPALSLAIGNISIIVRFLKNSIMENMTEDYVRTARSRGQKEGSILISHVLRNALLPVITILGMIIAETLSGTIIIENVFSLPGIGQLTVMAIEARDLPLVQALSLYIAAVVVIVNFGVDVLYRMIDPRMRF